MGVKIRVFVMLNFCTSIRNSLHELRYITFAGMSILQLVIITTSKDLFLPIRYYINMLENRFSKLLGEKRLDRRDIVKITGLDNHTVKKIYDDKITRIELNTLEKLCYALECDTNDIFKYWPDK